MGGCSNRESVDPGGALVRLWTANWVTSGRRTDRPSWPRVATCREIKSDRASREREGGRGRSAARWGLRAGETGKSRTSKWSSISLWQMVKIVK